MINPVLQINHGLLSQGLKPSAFGKDSALLVVCAILRWGGGKYPVPFGHLSNVLQVLDSFWGTEYVQMFHQTPPNLNQTITHQLTAPPFDKLLHLVSFASVQRSLAFHVSHIIFDYNLNVKDTT